MTYGISWFCVFFGGGSIGSILTDPDGWYFAGVAYLFLLPVGLVSVYFSALMRRRIGAFPRARLKAYVSETVFFQAMGCLPPIVYLTSESVKCILSRTSESVTSFHACGNVIFPQISITFSLTFMLVAKLILAPLTSTTVSAWQLASFQGISMKVTAN